MNASQTPGRILAKKLLWTGRALTVVAALSTFLGCTTISFPAGPIIAPPSYPFLTGNWQFVTTSTAGSEQFGMLAGYIDERSVNPGFDDPTTAILQVEEPSTCFLGTTVLPLQGDLKATALGLISFSDVSQFITIAATKDPTAAHLTGTYSVGGGCASGSQGTLVGTKYAPLTGTYSGGIAGSPGSTLSLTLTQSLIGNGNGTLNVKGSATITGNPCFSTASISAGDATVLGSKVNLLFDTNEAGGGSQMLVEGTFDSNADLITATSITVTGGACVGLLGTANLQLQ